MSAANAALVGSGVQGTVYLLHFDQPVAHARHYLGWAQDLDARLAAHRKAPGPALLRAATEAGVGWRLARVWPGDRYRERQLKARGHTRKCPICRAQTTGADYLFDPADAARPAAPRLRDGWGRYLIPDPTTGEPRAWTRVTTLARTIADHTAIEITERRKIAWGIGARPDLYARAAAATLDDTTDLDQVIEHAGHAAATAAGANTGTALHRFAERLDAGETLDVPAPWDRDLAAYRQTLTTHQITTVPGWLERILLIPEAGVAGTCDRLWTAPSWTLPRIGDLKTAQNIHLAAGEIALQLALYAHATHWWNPATQELHPITEPIDHTTAVVAHLPAGRGTCTLYDINITAGWDAVPLALAVREWRRRNDIATATPPVGGDTELLDELVDEVTRDERASAEAGL